MATESVKYVSPETKSKTLLDIFRRPDQHATGIVDWLTTIDHKKIGLLSVSYTHLTLPTIYSV